MDMDAVEGFAGDGAESSEGEKDSQPPPEKRNKGGRPARTFEDLFQSEAPDGTWDVLVELGKAIYRCNFCFPTKQDVRKDPQKPIEGRIIADLGLIVSKAKEHVRRPDHIRRKLEAESAKRMSLEDAFKRAEEEKKAAGRLVLNFTKIAVVCGISVHALFDSGALDDIVMEFPTGVRQNVKTLTRCSGCLPKGDAIRETFLPALFSIHLTTLREILKGKRYSIVVDESRDSMGRPLVNVLCQFNYDGVVTSVLIASKRIGAPANNKNVRETIDASLARLSLRWEDVCAVASDSASYLVKMMGKVKKQHPRVLHIRCLAHLLHNAMTAGIADSEVISAAVGFAVNLVRTVRPAAVQAEWASKVKTMQLVEPRRVPKYYEIRWDCLLTVLQFALDYLTGSVTYIRESLEGDTDLHRALKEACSGSSESGVIALLRTKILVAKSELERVAEFVKTMQLKDTTFGTLTKSIAFLEDNLKESAMTDEAAIVAKMPPELRGMMEPFCTIVVDNAKKFRKSVSDHFQASMVKHFYRDVRVAQLADCAQLLDARLPTRRRASWSMVSVAAKWLASFAQDPAMELERIRVEYELFKTMELDEVVTDSLAFWNARRQGSLRNLAAFASDLLALPIGSAEAERSFSEQHRTDTKQAASSSAEYAEKKAMLYQNRDIEVRGTAELAHTRQLVFGTWFHATFSPGREPPQHLLPDLVMVEAAECDDEEPLPRAVPLADYVDRSNEAPFTLEAQVGEEVPASEVIEDDEEG